MFSLSKRDCNYPSVCRYVHPLNKNTIYRHAWRARRLGGGGEGRERVVEMSQLKIMPIVSCFERLTTDCIYFSIPFHGLGVALHSSRNKE